MDAIAKIEIQRLGYQNGWEVVISESDESVRLGSAHHSFFLSVSTTTEGEYRMSSDILLNREEVQRLLTFDFFTDSQARAWDASSLEKVFGTLSQLARSLPDNPLYQYQKALASIIPDQTEVERIVKQRVGQNIFRSSLLDYWGGACALTGITTNELLRASHAKPWADSSDEERMSVFNGFVLEARFDVLFDQGLISFSDEGKLMISRVLDDATIQTLQLERFGHLRWVAAEHKKYLQYHRESIFAS